MMQPAPAAGARQVLRVRDGVGLAAEDLILDEVPVALVYNGVSHAVMMATPTDLEDFALGFSLTEGILEHPRQCYGIDVTMQDDGVALELEIASERFVLLKERRRTLAGRTGCGLCGVDSLRQVRRPLVRVAVAPQLQPDHVLAALQALRDHQALGRETGASHAAAWCALHGEPLLVREDVGRHNALDKVIGAMAVSDHERSAGFMLLTSRVSLEMVQKCAAAGVGAVVGMSAPTLAAVSLAEELGITLLAFARANGFVCYTHSASVAFAR